ncbi:hypothetical protein JIX56_19375 [Streptomyces sp. CA-210063]|uniref:hypothetical protein n=1 Tax=Streptomyces sp. CA-210063 TaxID=2801029 RepID=UPI00214A962F|nr:hypothetical protein [Streptomyces sp. CA-210063]UUU31890.1 hypothetical protein JIX56_19375 [Streptomyces sp. CA-210063]
MSSNVSGIRQGKPLRPLFRKVGMSCPFVQLDAYLFYGGDLQEGDILGLRDKLLEMAALSLADVDEAGVQGLFLVTHEVVEWQVRAAGVHVAPTDEQHQYLGPF